ncbi:hypothetical protein MJ547_04195, partial [Burkholderia gladioli]
MSMSTNDCIINERVFDDLLFSVWPTMIDHKEVGQHFDRFFQTYIAMCDEDGAEYPASDTWEWEELSSDMRDRLTSMIDEGGGCAQDAPRRC